MRRPHRARPAPPGVVACCALVVFTLTYLGLAPTHAADEDRILFDNGNTLGVTDGPRKPTRFGLAEPTLITHVRLYHYNGGRGAKPGWVRFDDPARGISYGLGEVRGVGPRPDGRALYWECTPNLELEPGTYDVVVSSPATWSWNAASGHAGIATIRGRPVGAKPPTRTPEPHAPPPAPPAQSEPTPPPTATPPTALDEFRMELLAPPGPDAEADAPPRPGRCTLSVPHVYPPKPRGIEVGTLALPDEARDPVHRIGGNTELAFPLVRLSNGIAQERDLTLQVKLIHDESQRAVVLTKRRGVNVPAVSKDEASGKQTPGVVEVPLWEKARLLDHLGTAGPKAAAYTIRFEAVAANGLPAAILDHSILLEAFRLDKATATREGDQLVVDLEGPALAVEDVEPVILLPTGQRIDAADLAAGAGPPLETTAEGKGRVRVRTSHTTIYVFLRDDEGRQSNRVKVATSR